MSQIASFYLLKDGQRQKLSNGDCSGVVYMAIWDWGEGELASKLLAALREQDLLELAAEIAPGWDLPAKVVQSGLETLRSHLELVRGAAALLYEML